MENKIKVLMADISEELTGPVASALSSAPDIEFLGIVSDGGTAQLNPTQDTYHYGDVVYINWEMDSGCHYEGITLTPAGGESQTLPPHEGEEFGYVLKGNITLCMGSK